jgi:hypothetical protein
MSFNLKNTVHLCASKLTRLQAYQEKLQCHTDNALQWWQLSSCQCIMSLMALHFAVPQEYTVERELEFEPTAWCVWLAEREALSLHSTAKVPKMCGRGCEIRSQPTTRSSC